MPPKNVMRGEVWITDLGMAGKIRPTLILSVPLGPADRVLYTVVPHTTKTHGTAFEVDVGAPFLDPGAFDPQGIGSVHWSRFHKRLGGLTPAQMALVEDAVRRWLGL